MNDYKYYIHNGNEYERVTTILDNYLDKSKELMLWAVKSTAKKYTELLKNESLKNNIIKINTNKLSILENKSIKEFNIISTDAMSIGSEAHSLIEKYIKNEKIDKLLKELPDEVLQVFNSFLKWEKQNNIRWLKSEFPIINEDYGYGGTIDAIAKIKDKLYIIDFKTSSGFYRSYPFQISAYRMAYEAMDSENKLDGMLIARFDKNLPIYEIKDYSKDYEKFSNCFKLMCLLYYTEKKRRCNNPITRKEYKIKI